MLCAKFVVHTQQAFVLFVKIVCSKKLRLKKNCLLFFSLETKQIVCSFLARFGLKPEDWPKKKKIWVVSKERNKKILFTRHFSEPSKTQKIKSIVLYYTCFKTSLRHKCGSKQFWKLHQIFFFFQRLAFFAFGKGRVKGSRGSTSFRKSY